MTGDDLVRRAIDELRRNPKHWPDEGPVTVEQIEQFGAELADEILSEVFDRLEEMRLR